MRQFKQIRELQRGRPVFGTQGDVAKDLGARVFGTRVYGATYEVREYGNGDRDGDGSYGGESPPSYGHACRLGYGDVEAALEGRGSGERF